MGEVVAPAETQGVWRMLRGELRRQRRQSETVLPNVATAAQHAALAGEHAQRSLEALGHVTTRDIPETIPPPPPREDEE